jgi:hypothetical protein
MAEKEKKEKTLFEDMGDAFKEYIDYLPSPPPLPPIPLGITRQVLERKKSE